MPVRLKLLVIVILLVVLGVKYHPRFQLTEVTFVGTNFVSTASLTAFVKQYDAQNLFWVRFFSRISSKICDQYPQIESVDLDMTSNHTLQIKVHEKKSGKRLVNLFKLLAEKKITLDCNIDLDNPAR